MPFSSPLTPQPGFPAKEGGAKLTCFMNRPFKSRYKSGSCGICVWSIRETCDFSRVQDADLQAGGPVTGSLQIHLMGQPEKPIPKIQPNRGPGRKALESERQGWMFWFQYLQLGLSLAKSLGLSGPQFPHLYDQALMPLS